MLGLFGACERLPLVRAGVARVVACDGEVNGVGEWSEKSIFCFLVCSLLGSACPYISFR